MPRAWLNGTWLQSRALSVVKGQRPSSRVPIRTSSCRSCIVWSGRDDSPTWSTLNCASTCGDGSERCPSAGLTCTAMNERALRQRPTARRSQIPAAHASGAAAGPDERRHRSRAVVATLPVTHSCSDCRKPRASACEAGPRVASPPLDPVRRIPETRSVPTLQTFPRDWPPRTCCSRAGRPTGGRS